METKRGMYEGIVIHTALYGSEAWVLENKVRNRMDVAEMTKRRNRVRNEENRRRLTHQEGLVTTGLRPTPEP